MILITGGAGFIGSNLLAALAARGGRVAVNDWLGHGDKWRNLAHNTLADVFAPTGLGAFLDAEKDRLRAVFHMGAISATTETDGDLLVETNFRLSKKLWEFCAAEGIAFIYASSAATYGDGSHGFDDSAAPEHLANLRPLNGYGWSKHLFDRWVVQNLTQNKPGAAAKPPQWAGLKFFNVYGPNEFHKGGQASVALHLFQQIQRGERAKLFQSHRPDYTDGGQLRDFVWVEDCVDIMLWLLDHPQVSGLFNVGTGQARSFADLAQAVYGAMGQAPAIDFIPTPEAIRDKYQYFTEARMARLRQAGYDRPFTSLEDGVGRYVRDFLSQEDPYK